jgi:hypothetical protein
MSMQQETDVHDHLSNQPSSVGSKCDSAVRCANPQCSKELLYLREGTLNLLEMEPHSDDQFQSDVSAFAMRSVPSKYCWLCGECTKTLIVKRWTTAGIELVLRNQNCLQPPQCNPSCGQSSTIAYRQNETKPAEVSTLPHGAPASLDLGLRRSIAQKYKPGCGEKMSRLGAESSPSATGSHHNSAKALGTRVR